MVKGQRVKGLKGGSGGARGVPVTVPVLNAILRCTIRPNMRPMLLLAWCALANAAAPGRLQRPPARRPAAAPRAAAAAPAPAAPAPPPLRSAAPASFSQTLNVTMATNWFTGVSLLNDSSWLLSGGEEGRAEGVAARERRLTQQLLLVLPAGQ